MLETTPYTLEELLRERREGAVRSLVRAVGYALAQGEHAEQVGRFLSDSYLHSEEFRRLQGGVSADAAVVFIVRHLLDRWGWCNNVQLSGDAQGVIVQSSSLLENQENIMQFHGVTYMDMEACVETVWRHTGEALGLEVTYTIGDGVDWLKVRPRDGGAIPIERIQTPSFSATELATHRRLALATGLTFSIGYAKYRGDEPEDLGLFFYKVWEESGHYQRLRERWGYGNAVAYAQSLARSRQIIYTETTATEDLDGYTITSPNWSTEIPHVMGAFGTLPDDVYRYYAGGGIPACAKLGLQYADQSDDRFHRVWIRSR